jgi:hypothetical protein
MYNAKSKFSIDDVFGGIMAFGAIGCSVVAFMYIPVADMSESAISAQKSNAPPMVAAQPGGSPSSGEVHSSPSPEGKAIVNKKYA